MAKSKPIRPSSRNCAVPNCINRYSGNDENKESYTLFGVPNNSLNAWQELMPKVKLRKSSKLCNRHFDDSDIVKGYNILGVFHPFKHWRLSVGANPKHHPGHSSTTPTISNLSSQKSKTTQKKICSPKTLPTTKDPITSLPRLLPKDTSDLAKPFNNVPEPIINIPGPSNTVPVGGPITHYIVVQDPISISNETTLTIKGGINLNAALSNLTTPSVQNDSMKTSSSSCSFDHSYVLVPPRSPTSLEDSAAPSSRNSESATCQQVQENAVPSAQNESDHNYVIRSSPPSVTEEEESLHLDLAGYRDFINGVATPTTEWTWSFNERNSMLVCSCHIFSYDGVMNIKSVRIVTMTKVALYINGKPITPPDFKFEFRSKEDLANILEDFNCRKICQGIVDDSFGYLEVTDKCVGNKEGNLWRSKLCLGLAYPVSSILCSKCRHLRSYLKKRVNEKKTKKLKNTQERYKLKLRSTHQLLRRSKSKIDALSGTIEEFRKERKKLYWNSFDVKLKLLKPKEQLVVKTMIVKATVNPGRNDRFGAMRYDSDFLKECVRIKKISSAAYKHLRTEGILPLPSQDTLFRMMKKIDIGESNKPLQSDQPNVSAETDLMEMEPSNVENEGPASPDLNESVSPEHDSIPEIILSHSEEVSVQEEMIVEILTIQ